MATVTLKNLLTGDPVLDPIGEDLRIEDRDFVAFVGNPEGGHLRIGRCLAGLERPAKGEVLVGTATQRGRLALVGGVDAFFTHMSARENLLFAIQQQKLGRAEQDRRISQSARLMGLTSFLDAAPCDLSEAQRLRVVFARAIAENPQAFVFQQSFNGLPPLARLEMGLELARLRQQLQAPMIWITSDANEALAVADKLVVFKNGFVQQLASPELTYHNPANLFVAGLFGDPPINLISGKVKQVPGGLLFKESGEGTIECKLPAANLSADFLGKELTLGLRPESIRAQDDGSGSCKFRAIVELVEFVGAGAHLHVHTGAHSLLCSTQTGPSHLDEGRRLAFEFDSAHAHLFDPSSSKRLL